MLKETHYPCVVQALCSRGLGLFVEVVWLLITYDTHENIQHFLHTALATCIVIVCTCSRQAHSIVGKLERLHDIF